MYKKLILECFNENDRKLSFADLKKKLGVKGEGEIASFSCALDELRYGGELYLGKDDTYRIFDESLGVKQGQIHINKGGIGFVRADYKGKEISYMIKGKDLNKYEEIIYGVLIGGIIGNLIDRVVHGSVIDYLDFNLFGYNFPVFNFADICIVISIILIIISICKGEKYGVSNK